MRIVVDAVAKGRSELPATTTAYETGTATLVVAETEQRPTVLGLVASGRMKVDAGSVTIDGRADRGAIRRRVALVDAPIVSEPEPNVTVTGVVAEELMFAGRAPTPFAAARWLEQIGLEAIASLPVGNIDPAARVRLLLELAALRKDVEGLVLVAPRPPRGRTTRVVAHRARVRRARLRRARDRGERVAHRDRPVRRRRGGDAMKIPQMITAELRRLTSTRMSVLALIALLAVPILYGGLYLWANQDPYGNLSNVPVALVVDDRGAEVNGEQRDLGDEAAEQLLDDGTFEWHRVSADQADAGLQAGDFDFIVTLPADFTEAVASLSSDSPRQADIELRTNDANNYLASTIGTQAVAKIQTSVAQKVIDEAGGTLLDALHTIRVKLVDATTGATQLVDGLATAKDGSSQLASGSVTLADGSSQLADGRRSSRPERTSCATGRRNCVTGRRASPTAPSRSPVASIASMPPPDRSARSPPTRRHSCRRRGATSPRPWPTPGSTRRASTRSSRASTPSVSA